MINSFSKKIIKHKIFLTISLIIALIDTLFVAGNYLLSKKSLEEDFSKQALTFSSSFNTSQNTAESNLLLIASIFANDQKVQELFLAGKKAVEAEGGGKGGENAARIRQELYDLVAPRWKDAIEKLGARQLHFHLGPGSLSFLRVHRPEKFGDRMDNVRFTIVDTNAEKAPRTGFETGRVYSGIRGVVPINTFDPETGKDVHVGALEAGISYRNIVRGFAEATNANVTVLLTKEHIESAIWPDFIKKRFSRKTPCGCVIEADSDTIPDALLSSAKRDASNKFIKTGDAQFIESDGSHYFAAFFPLRDYLGGRNHKRADVGSIVIWRDISDRIAAFKQGQWFNVGYGILAYLLVELLLLIGFRRGTKELQIQIDRTVTELTKSGQRLNFMQNALDNVGEAIYICDKNTHLQYVNEGAVRHLGYNRETLLNMSIADVDAGFPMEHWPEHYKTLQQQGSLTFESSHSRADGTTIPVEINANYIELEDKGHILGFARDISERKRAEKSLQQSSERYRSVVETAQDGFWVISPEGFLLEVNDAYCRMSGYNRDELIGMHITDLDADEEPQHTAERIKLIKQKGGALFETHHKRNNGEIWPVEVSTSYSPVEGGRLFVFLRDIHERKITEELSHLRDNLNDVINRSTVEEILQNALDLAEALTNSSIGFFHFVESDQENISLQTWSTRTLHEMCFAQGHGMHYPVSEAGVWVDCIHDRKPIIHNNYNALAHKKGLPEGHAPLTRVLTVPLMRNNLIVAVIGVGNKKLNYTQQDVEIVNRIADLAFDFVERKRADDQIEYMAYYDILTGLPNRAMLADRLNQAIAQHYRSKHLLAVCYMDLDGFKPVNDRYGHDVGDKLLVEFSKRIQLLLRDGDTMARLSGDEFVFLFTELSNIHEAEAIISRILESIETPFVIEVHSIQISASIGLTLYPLDDSSSEILLRHADYAMYHAKAMGKSRFYLYDAVHDKHQQAHRKLISEIEEALKQNEFILHYQPRVDLTTGKAVGVEALIRWKHSERGELLPGKFLHIIAGTEEELVLGKWVMGTALDQLTAWHKEGINIPMSINISPYQLQQPNFADELKLLLKQYPDGTAGQLELEILETSAIGDLNQVVEVMNACTELGVRFSLDDFGTGYSSLTYFQRLPIEILKIDQNFVRGMMDDVNDLDIVEGVLRLAHSLKRPVVAEGVESVELGLILMLLGCRYVQGFGIAQPMEAKELPEWIEQWEQDNIWQQLHQQELPGDGDIELKVAIFSHRRWLEKINNYVLADTNEIPPLDTHECQFGRWYQGLGQARYGNRPSYAFIPPKHLRVHELADAIIELVKTGKPDEARQSLNELMQAGEDLISLLNKLV